MDSLGSPLAERNPLWRPLDSPAAKTLEACGPSGVGLVTMILLGFSTDCPSIHYAVCSVQYAVCSVEYLLITSIESVSISGTSPCDGSLQGGGSFYSISKMSTRSKTQPYIYKPVTSCRAPKQEIKVVEQEAKLSNVYKK